MDAQITKKYDNGEVTVIWQPHMCIHSTLCFRGLPTVFDPRKRPWVTPEGSTTEMIVEQVKKCPSGALSYFMNNEIEGAVEVEGDTVVEILSNGPLLVYGNLTVKDAQGNETKKSQVTAFCRCGHSGNKPYCDGSHVMAKFEG
ncbi:(4Fe-4S)-binding protein [Runella sp.]|uniref:(4Fe-4S)-binding protein n=1 Tax=Runella sp. TaxID=1960881 RepID=UPI003D0F914B